MPERQSWQGTRAEVFPCSKPGHVGEMAASQPPLDAKFIPHLICNSSEPQSLPCSLPSLFSSPGWRQGGGGFLELQDTAGTSSKALGRAHPSTGNSPHTSSGTRSLFKPAQQFEQ